MGFKVFGKKDGKRTVSDNPDKRKFFQKLTQVPSQKAQSLDSYGIRKQEIPIVGFKVKSGKHPFPQKRLRKRKLYPIR